MKNVSSMEPSTGAKGKGVAEAEDSWQGPKEESEEPLDMLLQGQLPTPSSSRMQSEEVEGRAEDGFVRAVRTPAPNEPRPVAGSEPIELLQSWISSLPGPPSS